MLIDVTPRTAVVVSSLAWFATSVLVGWLGARWSTDRVQHTGPLTTLRQWEDGGRWWQRHLRVRSWKERVPEAGGLYGGFAKRRVPSRSTGGLEMFRRETIRSERVHWLIAASTPLHLIWCRPGLFTAMAAYGFLSNAPFIVIQRSNRGRLERLLERRSARTVDLRRRTDQPPPSQTREPVRAGAVSGRSRTPLRHGPRPGG